MSQSCFTAGLFIAALRHGHPAFAQHIFIVEGCLRGGNAGLGLCDLSRVVDLHQQIARLDALEILHCIRNHLAGNPAAQPRELGASGGDGV